MTNRARDNVGSESFQQLFLYDIPLLDVRAPSEFAAGAFPSALNLPLLDDEQRHVIGTEYAVSGQQAAIELGPQGIRVNCVSAGVVDTDALKHFPNRENLLEEYKIRTPLGPTLSPEQVAVAIYLLCLPESAMITGHTLFVDGGYAISG